VGHFYANDWGRGLKFLLFEAVGIGVMVSSVKKECINYNTYYYNDYYGYDNCESTINYDQYYLGAAIFILSRVWEFFDVYDAVEDYNFKLKQGLGLAYGVDHRNNLLLGLSYHY
jgi:hypothetical protein